MALDWDKLRVFYQAARVRNFSHAAEAMGLSQSAISRQVRALEESLRVELFRRHARGLQLTEHGEMLYKIVEQMRERLREVEEEIVAGKEKPFGRLCVTSTVGFGSHWLVPRLKGFVQAYPDIDLQILLTDEELDLNKREADIGVRFRVPPQLDLIQRSLPEVHYQIVAAPEYLAERGTPERLEDLDEHDLVVYGDTAPSSIRDVNWLVRAGRSHRAPRRPRLQVSSLFGVMLALQAGMGIGMLPNYMKPQEQGLRAILEDVKVPTFQVYLIYPGDLRNSKRVRAFCDFLATQIRGWDF